MAAAICWTYCGVEPLLAGRQLEVLGQPLIQPQRQLGHHAMQIGVRQLVPQIVGQAIAPLGIDDQLGIGLDEECPAVGKIRMAGAEELVEPLGTGEEVDLDRLGGLGQAQTLAQLAAAGRSARPAAGRAPAGGSRYGSQAADGPTL